MTSGLDRSVPELPVGTLIDDGDNERYRMNRVALSCLESRARRGAALALILAGAVAFAALAGCEEPVADNTLSFTSSALTGTQGAITFYMPYESTTPTPSIAGGATTPDASSPIVQVSGLFGQAESSKTDFLRWASPNNVDLSHPGSLAVWVKPDQWNEGNSLFYVFDGSRKMFVYNHDGQLFNRMENWGTPQGAEVSGGSITGWATGASATWHLVVASWGPDSLGISIDGAPATVAKSISWLKDVPTGAGWVYAGGAKTVTSVFALDELMVFNRSLWNSEVQWLWQTRTAPTSPNPAVARFGLTKSAITFMMPYESDTPSIAAGSAIPIGADRVQLTPGGLFGQAALSESSNAVAYPADKNIDLSKPGSAAFWIKPRQWSTETFLFTVIDGSRKMFVQLHNSNLLNRIEFWGEGHFAEVYQGNTAGWGTTDTNWHLLVATWGSDYIGFSVDGAPTVTQGAPWLAAVPAGTGTRSIYVGGDRSGGYLLDELVVFNRTLADEEIQWLYDTRTAPVIPNPVVKQFSSGDDSGRRVVTHYGYLPYKKTLQIELDLQAMNSLAGLTSVRLEVKDQAGSVVASTTMAGVGIKVNKMDWVLASALPAGSYTLVVTLVGMSNVPSFSYPFTRTVGPWEGNTLGTSPTTLVPPFTAIQVGSNAATIGTVGRSHSISDIGLWSGAKAGGQQILASKMRLMVGSTDVRYSSGTIKRPSAGSGTSASFTTPWKVSNPSLSGSIDTLWDYDGTMKMTLTLSPTNSTVSKLDLIIPFASKTTPLMHVVGDDLRGNYAGATPACPAGSTGARTTWDSRSGIVGQTPTTAAAADVGLRGQFLPYIWLGKPEAGLAVFAENDKGWSPSPSVPSHELVRTCNADGTYQDELRLHLIATPTTIPTARTIVLGFLATPVKPLPANWRLWTVGVPDNHPQAGKSYLQGQFGSGYQRGVIEAPEEYYPRGGDFTLYDKIAATRATRNTTEAQQNSVDTDNWIRNTWLPGYKNFGVTDAELPFYDNEIRNSFQVASGSSDGILSYTNPRGARFDLPEGQTFLNEWITWFMPPRVWPLRSGVWYYVDPVASYRDYAAFYYDRMLSTYGDGIYLDNVYLTPSYNTSMSSAYVQPDGAIQPAATLWDLRALIRRIAVQQAEKGKVVRTMAHMTNAAVAPVLAFAATQADWELGRTSLDYQDQLGSREYVQAESIGVQFGTVPFAVPKVGNTPHQLRAFAGIMLTHEIKTWDRVDDLANNRDRLIAFGYGGTATVYNYWQTGYPAPISGGLTSSLVVSKPGSAIVVVCDWQASAAQYSMTLNKSKLGLPATVHATDLESGLPVPIDSNTGVVTFTIGQHDFKVIQVDSGP